MEERCGNCKYFFTATAKGAAPREVCRRNPPQLVGIPGQEGTQIMGMFPPTQQSFWCAEWKISLLVAH